MKSTDNKENAVSPVVGVMLMIVVTIIIAAVVAAFASGLAADTQKSPVAQFGVVGMSLASGWDDGKYLETLTIVSKGGDIIQAGDIDVALVSEGNTYTFTMLGHKYLAEGSNYCDNFTVSSNQINAGNTIKLTHYNEGLLSATAFAAGKNVEFTVIDKATGNSIAGGKFIIS